MVLFINYGWVFNWDSNHPWTNELYKNGISEAFLFWDKLFCSEPMNLRNWPPQYLVFTLIFGATHGSGFPPRSFEAYPTHWPFGWPNVHVRIPLLQWNAACLPYTKCPQFVFSAIWNHNLRTIKWSFCETIVLEGHVFSKSMIVIR